MPDSSSSAIVHNTFTSNKALLHAKGQTFLLIQCNVCITYDHRYLVLEQVAGISDWALEGESYKFSFGIVTNCLYSSPMSTVQDFRLGLKLNAFVQIQFARIEASRSFAYLLHQIGANQNIPLILEYVQRPPGGSIC